MSLAKEPLADSTATHEDEACDSTEVQPDDAALLARILAGDGAALETVYARESARVYRYALAMSHNATLAADVMQEVFVQFATRPQGYDTTRGPLQGYLVGIARHQVLAAWAQEGRVQSLDALNEDKGETLASGAWGAGSADEASQDEGDPGQLLIARQTHAALMQAIARLPAPFREALVLVELQERPYAEAAAIAGIELNTLRTRLHRAKAKLAKLLNAFDDDDDDYVGEVKA